MLETSEHTAQRFETAKRHFVISDSSRSWNVEAHGEPQAIDESGNHKAHLDVGGTVRR